MKASTLRSSVCRVSGKATRRLCGIEPLERRLLLSAGSVDPSFNNGLGFQMNDFGPTATRADGKATVIQNDGKIIVAGEATVNGKSIVALERMNPDGSMDSSFGSGGSVLQDVVYYAQAEFAYGVGLQADGKIVVTGTAIVSSVTSSDPYHIFVARFNTDGSFDTSFGFGGSNSSADANPNAVNNDLANGMAIDPSGRIVVSAYSYNLDGSKNGIFVARFTAGGYLDSSFGVGGFVPISANGSKLYDLQNSLAIDRLGRIDMVFDNAGGVGVARLTSAGQLDDSFGFGGIDSYSLGTKAVTLVPYVEPDGKDRILIAGQSSTAIFLRVSDNGSLGSFLGIGNFVTGAVAVQSNGEILAAGVDTSNTNHAFGVVRFDISGGQGILDSSFGNLGRASFNFGNDNNDNAANAMAIDGDGRIILAGTEYIGSTPTSFATARLQGGEYAFGAGPASVPGVIPAENYDNGGEGVAYHDTDPTNDSSFEGPVLFSPYRPGSYVDIENTADGLRVGFATPGEYLRYTITVPNAGTYALSTRVSDLTWSGAVYRYSVDGTLLPAQTMPTTGLYTMNNGSLYLSAGTHVIQLSFLAPDAGGIYCGNYYSFQLATIAPTISGNVYNDLNGNGTKQSGEANLKGIPLYLDLNKDGKLENGEPTTLSDASGNYTFANLAPNRTYRVREQLPAGWRITSPAAGFYDVALASSSKITGKNFGDTNKVLISGVVFNDANGNKKQDNGESGLTGWRVYIDANNDGKYESNETSVLTGASGSYSFAPLAAGTYRVRVNVPSNWSDTTPIGGVYVLTIGSGQISSGHLFGEKKNVSLTPAGGSTTLSIAATDPTIIAPTTLASSALPFNKTLSASAQDSNGDTHKLLAKANTSSSFSNGVLSISAGGDAEEHGGFTTIDTAEAKFSFTFKVTALSTFKINANTAFAGSQATEVDLRLVGPGKNIVFDLGSGVETGPDAALNKTGALAAGTYTLVADASAGGGGGDESASFSLSFTAQ